MGEVAVLTDRVVSMGSLVAYGLWALGLALFGVGWLVDDGHLGRLGTLAALGGATAQIRQYFVQHNRSLRNAYELGRDSVTRLRQ